jgi:sugar phosphate isomerase/epimerase
VQRPETRTVIDPLNRREWLVAGALGLALDPAGAAASAAQKPAAEGDVPTFRFCLNTSTISGFKLPIDREAELAAKVGYEGIEPWIRELDAYAEAGGSLEELGRKFRDLGLVIPSAIGFFEWIVDDDERRARGLEEARRSMDVVRKVGGLRIAAPPFGAQDRGDLDLHRIAERYADLLRIGDEIGVVPEVEVWGFSKTLGQLGEAALVAIESGHPDACILPDVYHLYKGGSGYNGLRLLSGRAMHVFHMNDFPAQPPREAIGDSDRVYPGDGVAPLGDILRDLKAIGYKGWLSLELFNKEYWKGEAEGVARTGLEKMRAAVESAVG